MTKGRLALYFYAGTIAFFPHTYEKNIKTESLQQLVVTGPHVYDMI